MPLRCVLRPNRTGPRFWTAKNAISAACSAIRHGANRTEIEVGIANCGTGSKRTSDEVMEALAAAEAAMLGSNELFDADAAFLQRFLAVAQVLAVLGRLIAIIPERRIRLAVLAIVSIRELATARLADVAVRKAANDAAIAIVRRAAANEARFRRTGTGL